MEYKELLNKIITCTDKPGVSDLLLSPNLPPALRINGDLRYISDQKLTKKHVADLIRMTMGEVENSVYEKEMEVDYAYEYEGRRFRANAFTTLYGSAVSMRKISSKIPSIEEIGAPDVLIDLAKKDHGLILITGPTGSGKSTTLAAVIDYISKNSHKHIITIEDPVEFIFSSQKIGRAHV